MRVLLDELVYPYKKLVYLRILVYFIVLSYCYYGVIMDKVMDLRVFT